VTDTHGLSRREHLQVKIEAGELLTDEEWQWAGEVLSDYERDRLASQMVERELAAQPSSKQP
jgi:hypothetical protein